MFQKLVYKSWNNKYWEKKYTMILSIKIYLLQKKLIMVISKLQFYIKEKSYQDFCIKIWIIMIISVA